MQFGQVVAVIIMELWKNVIDLVSPGNLIRFGNINYTTLAAHLDLLEEFNQREIILRHNKTIRTIRKKLQRRDKNN